MGIAVEFVDKEEERGAAMRREKGGLLFFSLLFSLRSD